MGVGVGAFEGSAVGDTVGLTDGSGFFPPEQAAALRAKTAKITVSNMEMYSFFRLMVKYLHKVVIFKRGTGTPRADKAVRESYPADALPSEHRSSGGHSAAAAKIIKLSRQRSRLLPVKSRCAPPAEPVPGRCDKNF